MARSHTAFLRLSLLAALAAGGAHAQMVGGSGGFQSAPAAGPTTAVPARPSSTYSNPYTNNGVAGQAGSGAVDPATAAPYAMYAAPLPTAPSTMPVAGVQAAQPAPGSYGAEGQPAAPPRYSIESAPASGPYAPQYAPQPQYAQPQYAPPPQYAQPQYAPPPQYAQPQYAQPQPQYAPPPQYAQPQYAQQPQPAASQAMSPGYNQIPSPYAASRAAAMPAPQGPQAEGGYTLGPGDKVRVTVYGEQDLSGEYQLDGNGNIRMPLAGVVHAGGYTQQGLEGWLYAALVPNYLRNPRINVEIITYRPIYVVGQVQKPGQYAYVNDMSMMNAIGLAGGFTSQAKESSVYVRRSGETKEEQVSTAQPLLIRPGDTVRVDTTLFWDAMNMFAPLSGPAYLASSVR